MADIKVSALAAATDPTGVDLLGVQGGTSKKIDRDVLVGAKKITHTGGNGIAHQLRGSDISASAPNFNYGVSTFAGINLPASALPNSVFSMGWNTAADGSPEVAGIGSLRIAFEELYHQAGAGPAAFEWHLSSYDTAGVEHRPISAFLHKDASAGSVLGFAADLFYFHNYAGTSVMGWNFTTKEIDLQDAALVIRHTANNVQFLKQRNAADAAFLSLPYYTADDAITSPAATRAVGATPTTGTYPNQFAVLQATSLASNGVVLSIVGPSITGTGYAFQAAMSATTGLVGAIYNGSSNAAAHAVLELRTISTAAGDPLIKYNVNGGTQWQVGLDNSANDSFVWGTAELGSSDKMVLDTTGNLALPVAGTGFRVKEGSNAKQGVATLVGGTVTVSNTSVTANSRIMLTSQSDGGTPGFLRVSARTAGTSFTITSSSGSDTSVVAYQIFEPA